MWRHYNVLPSYKVWMKRPGRSVVLFAGGRVSPAQQEYNINAVSGVSWRHMVSYILSAFVQEMVWRRTPAPNHYLNQISRNVNCAHRNKFQWCRKWNPQYFYWKICVWVWRLQSGNHFSQVPVCQGLRDIGLSPWKWPVIYYVIYRKLITRPLGVWRNML